MFVCVIVSFMLGMVALFIGAGYYAWRHHIRVDENSQVIVEPNMSKRLQWYPETVVHLLKSEPLIKEQEVYGSLRSYKKVCLNHFRRQERRAIWFVLVSSLLASFGWLIPVNVFSVVPFDVMPIAVSCIGLLLVLMAFEYKIRAIKKKAEFRGRYRAEKCNLFTPVSDAELVDFSGIDEGILSGVLKTECATSVCFIHLLKAWSIEQCTSQSR